MGDRQSSNGKRKYEASLMKNIMSQPEFLIQRLKNDFENEEKSAKQKRAAQNAKIVMEATARGLLALCVVGGVLSVAVMAPNMMGVIGRAMNRSNFFRKEEFKKSVYYLKRRKCVSIQDGMLHITQKGVGLALKDAFDDLVIRPSEKWDGKWRIVIFDVPEKFKVARTALSQKLKLLGCYQLQKSVFVSPYPCNDEVVFVANVFNVLPFIKIIEATSIAPDREVRSHFDI